VLVDPRKKQDALIAVLRVLSLADKAAACRRATIEAGRFSWETTARKTIRVYSRLLGRRRRMIA
jgi:glycosyltransferase involved in cell wall biosynthesis